MCQFNEPTIYTVQHSQGADRAVRRQRERRVQAAPAARTGDCALPRDPRAARQVPYSASIAFPDRRAVREEESRGRPRVLSHA